MTPHRIYSAGESDMSVPGSMRSRSEDGNTSAWGRCFWGEESKSNSQMPTKHFLFYWSTPLWHAGNHTSSKQSTYMHVPKRFTSDIFVLVIGTTLSLFLICVFPNRCITALQGSWYSWTSITGVSWVWPGSKRLCASSSVTAVFCAENFWPQCCKDWERWERCWRLVKAIVSSPPLFSSSTTGLHPLPHLDPGPLVEERRTTMKMRTMMMRMEPMEGVMITPAALHPWWTSEWSISPTRHVAIMERMASFMKVETAATSSACRISSAFFQSLKSTSMTKRLCNILSCICHAKAYRGHPDHAIRV